MTALRNGVPVRLPELTLAPGGVLQVEVLDAAAGEDGLPVVTLRILAATHADGAIPREEGLMLAREVVSYALELEHDVAARAFFGRGEELPLSPQEYAILAFLAANPRRVLGPEELLVGIWGWAKAIEQDDYDALRTGLYRLGKSLRRHLGSRADALIQTRRGDGYCFVPEPRTR